jgi:hypothetical protein
MRNGRTRSKEGEAMTGGVVGDICRHTEPSVCHRARLAQLLLFKHFIDEMKFTHP